jgi:hypothetical protein
LLGQALRLCREAGLGKVEHIAIDSTKVRPHANRNRTVSYQQLQEAELTPDRRVRAMLADAAQVDRAEDARYGAGRQPEDLPAEPKSREQRRRKMREAKQRLEQQAELRGAQARQERKHSGGKHRNNASKKRNNRCSRISKPFADSRSFCCAAWTPCDAGGA